MFAILLFGGLLGFSFTEQTSRAVDFCADKVQIGQLAGATCNLGCHITDGQRGQITHQTIADMGGLALMEQDTSVACNGTTTKGNACTRKCKPTEKYCWQHNPNKPRCGQPTKSGQSCKKTVKTIGQTCSLHIDPGLKN